MSDKQTKQAKYNLIYEIKNLVNGKIYVGAHATNDVNDMYTGSGTLIKKAIKKTMAKYLTNQK
jgi:hypothetical protein